MVWSRLSSAVFALLIVWGTSTRASADDGEQFLIGTQALLTGGAVTAIVDSGSALWYNPAGLADSPRSQVDASASAYALRPYFSSDFLSHDTGATKSDRTTEFVVVPTSLSYARGLRRGFLGLGAFVTQSQDMGIASQLEAPNADNTSRALLSAAARTRTQQYRVATGYGVKLGKVRLGVSLLGLFTRSSRSSQLLVARSQPSGETEAFASESELTNGMGLGIGSAVGLRWQPNPCWRFGASVRTPSLVVYQRTDESFNTSSVTDDGVPSVSAGSTARRGFTARVADPFRLQLGAAYARRHAVLSMDVVVQGSLSGSSIAQPRFRNWEGRFGVTADLTQSTTVGGGAFISQNDAPATLPLGAPSLDFFGVSFGILHFTHRHLDRERENRERISFGTSVGVRYAYGVGSIGGLRLDTTASTTLAAVSATRASVVVHDASIYIGTQLHF